MNRLVKLARGLGVLAVVSGGAMARAQTAAPPPPPPEELPAYEGAFDKVEIGVFAGTTN